MSIDYPAWLIGPNGCWSLCKLAVRFPFETSDPLRDVPTFGFESFTVKAARNDYEVRLLPLTCLLFVKRLRYAPDSLRPPWRAS